MAFEFTLDLTGTATANLISNERQSITETNGTFSQVIIPDYAPFYLNNLSLTHVATDGSETLMVLDSDYFVAYPYQDLARETGKLTFGAIVVVNKAAKNRFKLTYQTIGDKWAANPTYVKQKLLELTHDSRIAYWDQLTNVQDKFPPQAHIHDVMEDDRWHDLIDAINRVTTAIANREYNESSIYPTVITYIDELLPPLLTKEAVGLGEVENYPVASSDEVSELTPVSKYVLLSQVIEIVNLIATSLVDSAASQIQNDVTTLTQNYNQYKSQLSSTISNLNSAISTLDSRIYSLESDKASSADVSALQNLVNDTITSLSSLNTRLDSLENNTASLSALNNLEDIVTSINSTLNDKIDAIEDTIDNLSSLDTRLDSLENNTASLSALNNLEDTITSMNSTINDKIDAIEDTIDNLEQEILTKATSSNVPSPFQYYLSS